MKVFVVLLLCAGCAHLKAVPAGPGEGSKVWLAAQQVQWANLREVLPDSLGESTELIVDSTRVSIARRCGATPGVWEMPDVLVVVFHAAATTTERVEALARVHGKAVSYRPVSTKPRDGLYLVWLRPTGQCDGRAASAVLQKSPAVSIAMPEQLLVDLIERPPT